MSCDVAIIIAVSRENLSLLFRTRSYTNGVIQQKKIAKRPEILDLGSRMIVLLM